MNNFWPSCGFDRLVRNSRGWLSVTPDYLRLFLARPELAMQEDSCAAEMALHSRLMDDPQRRVDGDAIGLLQDADARDNYRVFLDFRDALLAAGTLEACYLGLMRQGLGRTPPLFIDLLVQAIVRNLLDDCTDAWQARAGELLFRSQRVSVQEGRPMAGDRERLDMLSETAGMGDIGRLLREGGAPLRQVDMQVLGADNAAQYWQSSERHAHVLDLGHETRMELAHGLSVALAKTQSGPRALAQVLERWVAHLLGVAVRIGPRQRIDDPSWRWHIGLEPESSAILNALYREEAVEPARMDRLISLFQLDFEDTREMRADVAGRPVYLGLAMNAEQVLRLKPQNLLLNLPLARAS